MSPDIFVSVFSGVQPWLLEFPVATEIIIHFLLRLRDQSGGVKLSLIVQERSCVPRPVLLELPFTPWGWIPLETAFITWVIAAVLPYLFHTLHLQLFLELVGGKDVDLSSLLCLSIQPHR